MKKFFLTGILLSAVGITNAIADTNNPFLKQKQQARINEEVNSDLQAARNGNKIAQYNMGVRYLRGEDGITKDPSQAVLWFSKAAEQGLSAAANALGVCYEKGNGVEQSYTTAVKWYRKAAAQNNTYAIRNLGICYFFGWGVEKSDFKAVRMFNKAALKKDATAQFFLAVCYEAGLGVGENKFEAKKWYYKSARQGHRKALEWVRKRAGQGDTEAQRLLEKIEDEEE